MTTKPNDPAYPNEGKYEGLTKRELIAAMAMQGLCSVHDRNGNWTGNMPSDCAVEAVTLADELIKCLGEMK